ncbi:MAG: hypothetical protein AAB701_02490 [Patescibacteria group bacterium]
MTTLVVGADGQGMRFVLVSSQAATIDTSIEAPASQRQEIRSLAAFLHQSKISLADIERFVSIELSHSRTSVRVIATLLKTTAWFLDKRYSVLPSGDLHELDTATLAERAV